jgi:hypothetical protein
MYPIETLARITSSLVRRRNHWTADPDIYGIVKYHLLVDNGQMIKKLVKTTILIVIYLMKHILSIGAGAPSRPLLQAPASESSHNHHQPRANTTCSCFFSTCSCLWISQTEITKR